jgi:hypothetical protein
MRQALSQKPSAVTEGQKDGKFTIYCSFQAVLCGFIIAPAADRGLRACWECDNPPCNSNANGSRSGAAFNASMALISSPEATPQVFA